MRQYTAIHPDAEADIARVFRAADLAMIAQDRLKTALDTTRKFRDMAHLTPELDEAIHKASIAHAKAREASEALWASADEAEARLEAAKKQIDQRG